MSSVTENQESLSYRGLEGLSVDSFIWFTKYLFGMCRALSTAVGAGKEWRVRLAERCDETPERRFYLRLLFLLITRNILSPHSVLCSACHFIKLKKKKIKNKVLQFSLSWQTIKMANDTSFPAPSPLLAQLTMFSTGTGRSHVHVSGCQGTNKEKRRPRLLHARWHYTEWDTHSLFLVDRFVSQATTWPPS